MFTYMSASDSLCPHQNRISFTQTAKRILNISVLTIRILLCSGIEFLNNSVHIGEHLNLKVSNAQKTVNFNVCTIDTLVCDCSNTYFRFNESITRECFETNYFFNQYSKNCTLFSEILEKSEKYSFSFIFEF